MIMKNYHLKKFKIIIGPCSADRHDAVLDYIHRLADVQKEVENKILIIPRIYTGKPRTCLLYTSDAADD